VPVTIGDLARLIEACDQLPEHIRAAMLTLLGGLVT
jgi:hypothetical protein